MGSTRRAHTGSTPVSVAHPPDDDADGVGPGGARLGGAPGPGPSVAAGEDVGQDAGWAGPYTRQVVLADALAVAVALGVAYVARFSTVDEVLVVGDVTPSYLSVAVALFVGWLVALAAARTRDRRVFGTGSTEYARVAGASWRLFAVVAVAAYLLKMQLGRGFLAIAFPLGLCLLLLGRYGCRRRLHRERDHGGARSSVVVVGPRGKAEALIRQLHRNPRAGYRVTGVCLAADEGAPGDAIGGVPVRGSMPQAAAVAVATGASAIAIAGSDAMTADVVRRLGWDLEGTGIDLVLTLALTDVAGPRMLMQPVNGLPLVYVDEPRLTGWRSVVKALADRLGAAAIALVLSPVLLVVAALVKATSPGPVLYRQERVGKDGRPFSMLKFRSMHVGAHDRLAEVLAAEGVTQVGAFYKPRNDPRVTSVGRVLRKYSLDELPQLFNVVEGTMSLVGPRPQIAQEVAGYDRAAHRRLLVKPGMTGLWQVSGRSSLDPEDAMRLDVAYVENWSLVGDLLILARTARAMVTGEDAV